MEMLREEGGILYPGVAEGLAALAKHYPLFIVSNCDSDYLDIFFHRTRLRDLFRDAECYGNTGMNKAENLKAVVERNRLRKPAYMGDTAGDQIAARKAGMDYYHVTYGFGQPHTDCLTFDSFAEACAFFSDLETLPQGP
jgi:phosphoglycolate phosphatase